MTYTPLEEREHPVGSGVQKLYRFPNGYGASVVRFTIGSFGAGSYGADAGLWELGVLKFEEDEWSLTYETPITDDVLGWLDSDAVEDVLAQIEALPPWKSEVE